VLAQDQPAAYSKEEVDAKLKDMESKADTDARFRDVHKKSEIDGQFEDLRKSISQNASKSDVDARIVDLRTAFNSLLSVAEQRNAERKADLERQIDAVASKIPTFPPWIAAAISAFAAVVSIVSIIVAYSNVSRAAAEARRAAREARADGVIEQWQGLSTKVGQARGLFRNPNQLLNPDGTPNLNNYALIAEIGNWYERMANQWRHSTADRDVLRKNGLRRQAQEFWNGVQGALTTLPDLATQITDWTDLHWLATNPDA
jgi:hypothetical protein